MREPEHEPDEEGIRQQPRPIPRPKRPGDDDEDQTPLRRAMGRRVVTTQHHSTDDPYQTHFPPWAGPVGGPLVIGLMSAYASYESEGRVSPTITLCGAAVGLALGTVVWLCDRPSGRGKSLDVTDQGTFIGRFLALLSAFLFFLPILGLCLSGWAVFLNRRRGVGWPWLVSRVAFALASLISIWVVLAILLAKLWQ